MTTLKKHYVFFESRPWKYTYSIFTTFKEYEKILEENPQKGQLLSWGCQHFLSPLPFFPISSNAIQVQYITGSNRPAYIQAHVTYQIALLWEVCLSETTRNLSPLPLVPPSLCPEGSLTLHSAECGDSPKQAPWKNEGTYLLEPQIGGIVAIFIPDGLENGCKGCDPDPCSH